MSYHVQYSSKNKASNMPYYLNPNIYRVRDSLLPKLLRERNQYLKQNVINDANFINQDNYYHDNFPKKEPNKYYYPHSHLHNVIQQIKLLEECNYFPRNKAEIFLKDRIFEKSLNAIPCRYYPETRDYEINF